MSVPPAGWGYTRVLGELRKLGITDVSRATVRRILIEHKIEPAPRRPGQSWDAFIKAHAETLWACDFFTKPVWTPLGPRIAHVLFFLHVGSRRVIVSQPTVHPTRAWSAEQARKLLERAELDGLRPPSMMLRDGDGKFGTGFNRVLKESGCRPKRLPPRTPVLNAYAERWIQSIKRECLDRFIVFGLDHLDYLIRSYLSYYHEARPHQGLGNRLIKSRDPPGETGALGPVRLTTRLGGVLKSYERDAA